ncbi:hypothetical protein HF324_17585 [Chitinophaga oryzae]|uniref:Yip1 domain-containing protein n=1 Tax=Chitinophaga oryzae TaxID=2725414 RepID=A0ABX6LHU7_9BACT|nr:YIP1 family protein [Chitinophaga oryzae]QJB39572.1 hypothetical protein HF324_17585 [Chitinophaga oryzae]
MNTWLLRPFTYIAGSKALLLGWAVMLVTSVVAYFSKTHFDGAIDAHAGATVMPYFIYLLEAVIAWGCMVLACYAAAAIFARSSFRLIDIAGTLALARTPLLAIALINFGMPVVENPMDINPTVITLALISLPFFIWMLVLMYQGFSVSVNMKGNKAVIVFIVALIVAEVISKALISFTFPLLLP